MIEVQMQMQRMVGRLGENHMEMMLVNLEMRSLTLNLELQWQVFTRRTASCLQLRS